MLPIANRTIYIKIILSLAGLRPVYDRWLLRYSTFFSERLFN